LLLYFVDSLVQILSNNRGLAQRWIHHFGFISFVWIRWLVEEFPYLAQAATGTSWLEMSSSESKWQNSTNKTERFFVVG
jgi:hypothetical protein